MSSTSMSPFVVSTITSPMTSRFTPPTSCSTHWTYEAQSRNSVPGGLLLQDAQGNHLDTDCFPSGFEGWGRAPSFIQVFSPGVCPFGYTTALNNYNGDTTTAVCCPNHFLYTTTVSDIVSGTKTAAFYGCTSIYLANAGPTTVFVEGDGFSSNLDGTSSVFTSVSGPVMMWAQPITIAFQKTDLSLFTTPFSTPLSTPLTHTTDTSTTTSSPANRSSITSTESVSPTVSPSSGLSSGAIAGIAIGAAAVLGLLIGGAILFRRRQKTALSSSAAHDMQSSQDAAVQGYHRPQEHMNADGPRPGYMYADNQYDAMKQNHSNEWWNRQQQNQWSELSNHADRRHELG